MVEKTETEALAPLLLVADDERDTRMVLRRVFQREKFRIEDAVDGYETVAKTRLLHPDLILLDVQMPGMDGFEVIKQLREDPATARIPVIVLTAAAREPADVAHGLALGASDYVRKPFNLIELVARVNSILRTRMLEEHLAKRTEELEALIQVGGQLNEELGLEELVDRLANAALEQIQASAMILLLVDSYREVSLLRAYGVDGKQPNRFLQPDTLPGCVLETGETAAIPNLQRSNEVRAIFPGSDCISGIAAPLKHGGSILGVLALGERTAGYFSEAHLRLLRSIAEQAALAVRNAQLHTELQQYAIGLEKMVEARTAELQSAQAQLVRAEKMAALGTLAAGVAHEINNPLQPLLTNLEMALEDYDEGRPLDRELLDYAHHDVQRIKRIVTGLLDFAKPSRAERESVDVDHVFQEVLTLAGKQLQHARVKLATDFGIEHEIQANTDQLKQVFLNLIVNAMDAMPNGGALTIRTEECESFVRITVHDTGMGIPEATLPKIFDPFFTTKVKGTGLGLAVTQSLIEGHGGSIEVNSEVGQYTEFVIELPIAR